MQTALVQHKFHSSSTPYDEANSVAANEARQRLEQRFADLISAGSTTGR